MMNVNSDLHDLEQMPVPAVNSTNDITHTVIEHVVIQSVPDASLLSAQHIWIGLASLTN